MINRDKTMAAMLSAIDDAEDKEDIEERGAVYRRPRPPREPSQVYSVRISVDRLQLLRDLAESEGVTPSALARRLVVEGLHRAISGRPEVERLRHQVVELEERLTAQTTAFTQRLDEISEILEKHNREVPLR